MSDLKIFTFARTNTKGIFKDPTITTNANDKMNYIVDRAIYLYIRVHEGHRGVKQHIYCVAELFWNNTAPHRSQPINVFLWDGQYREAENTDSHRQAARKKKKRSLTICMHGRVKPLHMCVFPISLAALKLLLAWQKQTYAPFLCSCASSKRQNQGDSSKTLRTNIM